MIVDRTPAAMRVMGSAVSKMMSGITVGITGQETGGEAGRVTSRITPAVTGPTASSAALRMMAEVILQTMYAPAIRTKDRMTVQATPQTIREEIEIRYGRFCSCE